MTSWPQSGATKQPGVGQLAAEPPGVVDRDEESRSPTATSAGSSIRRSSRGPSSGWTATSCAIAGSSRRHAPGPWTGSWRRASAAARSGSFRSIQSGSMQPPRDARAWLTLGGDPGDDQRPQPLRPAHRELERGHRAHRESDEMERRRARARRRTPPRRRPGPRSDQPPAGVPACRGVPARVGQVDQERLRESGDLGGEVLAPGRGRTVEHDQRWTGAVDLVADVEAVGVDGRHRRQPSWRPSTGLVSAWSTRR